MQLKNRRHENFCRNYALVPNGTRAAHMCGYSRRTARYQASRLLRRSEIAARIAELRAETARRNCLDADALFGKLEAVYDLCIGYGRFGPAVRAVEAQARLAGYLTAQAARADIEKTRQNAALAKTQMLSNVDRADGEKPGAVIASVSELHRVNGEKVARVAGSA
jgi:multidrug efflux pump subunit AcrA (membrane-fusion protein)